MHIHSKNYSIRPWRTPNFSTDIVGAPVLRISAEEAARLRRMIQKLQVAIRREMTERSERLLSISPLSQDSFASDNTKVSGSSSDATAPYLAYRHFSAPSTFPPSSFMQRS